MFYDGYAQYEVARRPSRRERALAQFREALLQGWLNRLVALVMGRANHLDKLGDQHLNGERRHAGLRTVRIEQITGSENRSLDFDRQFHPLGDKTRDRWLSVMEARLNGVAMPPVQLTEVNGHYYVRDGHHRISVAAAMGETFVEAVVEVWR